MPPAHALELLGRRLRGRPVLLRDGPLAMSWRVQLPGEGLAVLRVDRGQFPFPGTDPRSRSARQQGPGKVTVPELPKDPGADDAAHRGGNELTVPGFRATALGLDRALEYRLLGRLAPMGLAPAPLAADPGRGLLLRAWVPGPTWDEGPGPTVEQAAAALARVHAITLPPGEIPIRDWAGTIARYAALAGPAGAATAARARAALDGLPPSDPVAAVLCHHDPLPANVLASGLFLDWEYCLAGNPLFDVAVLGLGLGLSRQKDWARLAAAWAAHRPGGPPASHHLPAWARFAHAVGDLWSAAITGQSAG
jgi:hypothetical protein